MTNWPLYSPDLNPIEHVWKALKKTVLDLHPELTEVRGEDSIREAVGTALQEAWSLLLKELFDRLMESMEDRVKACIKAKGCHTKY